MIIIDVRCCRSEQRLTLTVDQSRSCHMILGAAAAAFGYRSLDEVCLMHLGLNTKLTELDLSLEQAGIKDLDELGILSVL